MNDEPPWWCPFLLVDGKTARRLVVSFDPWDDESRELHQNKKTMADYSETTPKSEKNQTTNSKKQCEIYNNLHLDLFMVHLWFHHPLYDHLPKIVDRSFEQMVIYNWRKNH